MPGSRSGFCRKPINEDNPDGSVRQLIFGDAEEALLTFLILDYQRRVDILKVVWIE